jgi:adenosylmethionine-8-amino-7-oxononanoate aminotransferase
MSFHYWKNLGKPEKCRFVSLENSYHGETVGALAVTDVPIFSATYAELTKSGIRVPTPDARQAAPGEDAEAVAVRAATALENVLAKQGGTIAALILEPLAQGAAGMAMHHPEYLRRARAACDRYGVHLIADEIAVGFGRTGTLFAYQQAGIQPDFLCLSKGITGGFLPLSCVLTTDQVYQAFYHDEVARGFLHSHSYTGNALACRAALAVLDLFEQEHVLERNRATAADFTQRLQPLAQHSAVEHFRQCGMIWAFDVKTERSDFPQAYFSAMLDQNCLVRPIGKTVYFMPPYIIEPEHMDKLVEASLRVLDQPHFLDGTSGHGVALP